MRARVLVTVEEIVEELEPRPAPIVLPHWAIDYVADVPERRPPVLRATATRSETTTSTSRGTRSAATATRSCAGWRPMSSAG